MRATIVMIRPLPSAPLPTLAARLDVEPGEGAASQAGFEFILQAEGRVFSVVQPNPDHLLPGQTVNMIFSDHTVLTRAA